MIMPEDGEGKGSWCSLPVLLLWMIKDKLDIFDNGQFAAVCRNWWSVSVSDPKRLQSVGDGLPWICQPSSDFGGSSLEFISVTRERKFTIDLPEFRKASVVSSKCGWILLSRSNFNTPPNRRQRRLPDSLFLVNLFTGEKVKLPDLFDIPAGRYQSSFSIHEGYPHCVVLLKFGRFGGNYMSPQLTIQTAYPGDEVWTEHPYLGQRTVLNGCTNLVTMGRHVYCYNGCGPCGQFGRMIIYNMDSDLWKELPGSEVGLSYIAEHDGEIVKMVREVREGNYFSYKLFKYNDADTAWERLNNDAMRDTSWYLCDPHNCFFSAKEQGMKVYDLCPCRNTRGFKCCDAVDVHDLLAGTRQTLHLPYQVQMFGTWVGIG
ncbi:F-box protein At4g00893-like [Rhododendron vialii]|uniref:F-box protein At4g00893-like n=1 Tax=Rhododendron vialii TaxID=182163 RepID=UPI00265FC507|nr:F-box protein At4g00893-like [Rhododendron vialii]